MDIASLARWELRHLVANPWAVLGALVLTCLPFVLENLRPLGLASPAADPAGTAYEVAFMALLGGSLLGLLTLRHTASLLERADPATRLAAELVLIAVPATLGAALACLAAAIASGSLDATWVLATATGLLHLVALTALLGRLPGPAPAFLLALVWLVPAVLGPLVDPSLLAPFLPTSAPDLSTPASFVFPLASAAAFLLAAALLRPTKLASR